MRLARTIWVHFGLCLLVASIATTSLAQENAGEDLLDKATELSLKATGAKDFDEIADLCEEAIEKGLEESSVNSAKQLWASMNMEHAKVLAQDVFAPEPDRRWKFKRQTALDRLEKAVELQPEMTEAWLLIAQFNLLEGGDDEAAREAVTKAYENSSDDPDQQAKSLLMRAQLTDDPAKKQADIDKALEIDPENILALRLRGGAFVDQEKYDEAIADYTKLAESTNNNPMDLLMMAQRLQTAEKSEPALKAVSKAIEINPDVSMAHGLRAEINLALKNDEDALVDVTKAIELNPRDTASFRLRANINYQLENFDDAIKDIEKLLTFQPGDVQSIYLRSFIYLAKEDYEPAIDDMKLLVEQIPGEPTFRNSLAMIYNAADRHEDSIEMYNELLEEDPTDERALRGRGDVQLALGKHKEAIEDYEAALKLNEEDEGTLNNLAWVLCTSTFDELRDGERALKLATTAAEITEHKQAHILSTLAAAYAETGDFENAVKWSEKSVGLADDGRQEADLKEELELFKAGKPVRENEAEERAEKEKKEGKDDKDDEDEDKEETSDEDKKDG